MSSNTYNIAYLQACLAEMENYLLSSTLYGQLHTKAPAGEPPFASLTLGNVLLARQELRSRSLDENLSMLFQDLESRLDMMRSQWFVAWEEKIKREYPARLRQWGFFLDELRRQLEKYADRYPYEVRQRVILELLGKEVQQAAEDNREKLFALDEALRKDFVEGEFVWDEEMKDGFPKEVYWYLWGRVEVKTP